MFTTEPSEILVSLSIKETITGLLPNKDKLYPVPISYPNVFHSFQVLAEFI